MNKKIIAGLVLASLSSVVSATSTTDVGEHWQYTDVSGLHIAEYGRFSVLCSDKHQMLTLQLDDKAPGNFKQYPNKVPLSGFMTFGLGSSNIKVDHPVLVNIDDNIGVLVMSIHHPEQVMKQVVNAMTENKKMLVSVHQAGYILEYQVNLSNFKQPECFK